MNLFNSLFLTKEIKSQEGVVHFRRWRFLELPFLRVYLHNILRADEDKHQHDHPWSFCSFILKGGYKQDVTKWWTGPYETISDECRAGSFRKYCSRDTHKLTELFGSTWSIVVAWGFKREWGYQTIERGWLKANEYRRLKRLNQFDLEHVLVPFNLLPNNEWFKMDIGGKPGLGTAQKKGMSDGVMSSRGVGVSPDRQYLSVGAEQKVWWVKGYVPNVD
jgi:hypothetical protein